MLKKLKNNQGFTIIEVLIVLAIAALILLIVFLAVPALQRNTRNTTRKQDAGRVAAAVNNYVSNHNGTAPKTTAAMGEVASDAGKLGQYGILLSGNQNTPAKSTLDFAIPVAGNSTAAITVDGMQIQVAAVCDNTANDGSVTLTGASARTNALQYVSENSDGTFAGHCLDI